MLPLTLTKKRFEATEVIEKQGPRLKFCQINGLFCFLFNSPFISRK